MKISNLAECALTDNFYQFKIIELRLLAIR